MDPIYSQADGVAICQIVRSLVEEWGQEKLAILAPKVWSRRTQLNVLGGKVQFVTEDALIFIVGSGDQIFRREIKLADRCLV